MSKNYTIPDYRKLKKVSSFAKMYKNSVSSVYVYKMRDEGKIEFLDIDGVLFVDLSSLPEEIKKNLKKI